MNSIILKLDYLLDLPRTHCTNTAADCRTHAAEFLAQAEREPETKAHMVSMAESWLRLALQADRIEALSDHGQAYSLNKINARKSSWR